MRIKQSLLLFATFLSAAARAYADPFSLPTAQVEIAVPRTVNHAPVQIAITAAAGFDYSQMHV